MDEIKNAPGRGDTGPRANTKVDADNSTAQIPLEPTPLSVNAELIPSELRNLPQWLCWRYESRGGKWTKPPICASTGGLGKSNDPTTWRDFNTALAAYRSGRYSGIGFAFRPSDGLVGIDLDHCRNSETGELTLWAQEIVDRFAGTYIEISPSGEGIRIFCKGKAPRCGKGTENKAAEIYDHTSPRYLTITGHRLSNSCAEITEQQDALDWLYREYFAPRAKPNGNGKEQQSAFTGSDAEIIAKASRAKNGDKFTRLLSGEFSEYPSQSEADAALCSILAFWTQDEAQIDRIVRGSGLMREKWDAAHHADGSTYGAATIRRAIEARTASFGDAHPAPIRGERGERGENPRQPGDSAGANDGRKGANLGEFSPFEPEPYPIEALGPLAEACTALAEGGQLDPAMAGQCLLSTAALLTQARANVRTLAGVKPLSLYLLTVGDSGDGKSTAEDAALAPIRDHQRRATSRYQDELAEWEERCASRKKNEPKPEKPRCPYVTTRDGTVEGIRRGFAEGVPSQGVFTSEAAVMLAGYGMNADNRAKTAGTFNALWDDGEISVSRSLAGRLQLYDRRLSLHWLIQPDAAGEAINDPLLSGIGFWPRFLVAWPAPSKPRTARPFRPENDPRIRAFQARCAALVSEPLGEDCGNLPVLEMTPDAHAFACKFFERMEQAAKGRGAKLEAIKPFALRATEQLFRVAGVLTAYAGQSGIDLATAQGAGRLVAYSLETWRNIFGARHESEIHRHAGALLLWLEKQPGGRASETAMIRIGPKPLRSKARRDAALAALEQAGAIFPKGHGYWSINRD